MSEMSKYPSGEGTFNRGGDASFGILGGTTEDIERRQSTIRSPPTVRRVRSLPDLQRSRHLLSRDVTYISFCEYLENMAKVKAERIRAERAFARDNAIHYDIRSLYDDVVQGSPPFNPQDVMNYIAGSSERHCKTELKGNYERSRDLHYIRNKRTNAWIDWPDTNTWGKEKELCSYLNNIADSVRKKLNRPQSDGDLVFSSVFEDHDFETGHTTDIKPDLVVIPRGQKDATWADFRCVVALNIEEVGRSNECAQIMEHARRYFSKRPDRRYVIGLGFLHNNLSLHVFDRSGILATPYYNVNQHPEQFLQLAISILFMDNAQLGYDTSFYHKDRRNYIRAGGEDYEILCKLYIDKTLRGRGTVCLKATDKAGKVVVIKDSWVDRTRATKEVDMLKLLKGSGIENIPTLYSDEIVSFPGDTTRKDCTENFRRSKILEELKDKDRLEAFTVFRGNELRDHYRIVQGPYGEPLHDFDSLPELLSAAYDIFDAIEALNNMGIVHRDVSLNNIILVSKPHLPLRMGYLIDFDCALKKDNISESDARAGTIPFMAFDILMKEAKHSFIHDAESVAHILFFISCNQGGPHYAKRADGLSFRDTSIGHWDPAEGVTEEKLERIGISKCTVMNNGELFRKEVIKSMSDYFKPLRRCFLRMRKALFPPSPDSSDDDSNDDSDYDSDYETPTLSDDELDRIRTTALKNVKNVVLASLKELAEKSGLRLRDATVDPDNLRKITTYLEDSEAQPTHPLQTRPTGGFFPVHSSARLLGKRSREFDTVSAAHSYGNAESVKKSRMRRA